jgi:hypothetical protein
LPPGIPDRLHAPQSRENPVCPNPNVLNTNIGIKALVRTKLTGVIIRVETIASVTGETEKQCTSAAQPGVHESNRGRPLRPSAGAP